MRFTNGPTSSQDEGNKPLVFLSQAPSPAIMENNLPPSPSSPSSQRSCSLGGNAFRTVDFDQEWKEINEFFHDPYLMGQLLKSLSNSPHSSNNNNNSPPSILSGTATAGVSNFSTPTTIPSTTCLEASTSTTLANANSETTDTAATDNPQLLLLPSLSFIEEDPFFALATSAMSSTPISTTALNSTTATGNMDLSLSLSGLAAPLLFPDPNYDVFAALCSMPALHMTAASAPYYGPNTTTTTATTTTTTTTSLDTTAITGSTTITAPSTSTSSFSTLLDASGGLSAADVLGVSGGVHTGFGDPQQDAAAGESVAVSPSGSALFFSTTAPDLPCAMDAAAASTATAVPAALSHTGSSSLLSLRADLARLPGAQTQASTFSSSSSSALTAINFASAGASSSATSRQTKRGGEGQRRLAAARRAATSEAGDGSGAEGAQRPAKMLRLGGESGCGSGVEGAPEAGPLAKKEELLALPPSQFRSLIKEHEAEMSAQDVVALRRERRRLLNRSYQQRSRNRKAAKLASADDIMEAHRVYAARVRELASTHLQAVCAQPSLQAFLAGLEELDGHFKGASCDGSSCEGDVGDA